jgi:hypothetical protein
MMVGRKVGKTAEKRPAIVLGRDGGRDWGRDGEDVREAKSSWRVRYK